MGEGDLDCTGADIQAVLGLPQWRTVEALDVVGATRALDAVHTLLTSPQLRGLERLGRVDGDLAPRLVARDEPWALSAMQIWGHYANTGEADLASAFSEALAGATAAANIVELGLMYAISPTPWKDDWSTMLAGNAARLRSFEIALDSQSKATQERWLLGSVARELPVASQRYTCTGNYRHRSGWEYALERSDAGKLEIACTYKHRPGKGEHFGRLATMLKELPKADVVGLVIKAPRYSPSAEERTRLQAAVRRLSLEQPVKLPS